jgi:hypothetical protein
VNRADLLIHLCGIQIDVSLAGDGGDGEAEVTAGIYQSRQARLISATIDHLEIARR